MAERRRAHHALVHKLLAQGAGFRRIARHLGWSHRTVSEYAHAATWQELVVGQKPRPSLVDPFKPHLLRRIGEGRVKVSTLVSRDHRSSLHRQLPDRPQVRRAVPQ
ncbi:hypothetical protein ACQEVC_14855 [Plantactinospora sp. CA-294935]|uniref:hypothetical protein n=1 Tax=Plantactinospora sp. CA-294935 TaxID=3240012 RepID=UPI003D92E38B